MEGEQNLEVAFQCFSRDHPILAHQALLALVKKSTAALIESGVHLVESGEDYSDDDSDRHLQVPDDDMEGSTTSDQF